jgi:vitamin B12 transporter
MKGLNVSIVALVSALAVPAQAQEIELDEIVVSANQTETEKAKVGASVSTVSAAQLSGAQGVRATAALEKLPGVTLRTLGPIGTRAGVTIRGVPHTNVIVRVDGIDVTDPAGTQVSFDFGRLSFGDVSRIELARGAQSALYGSRANGGVISMTTRRATQEGLSQEAALEAGSYQTLSLSYGLAIKQGVSDVALTLSQNETEGYSAADDSPEADGYRADRLSFSAGHEFANGLRLSLNGFYDDSWMEYDEEASGLPLDGTPDEQEDRVQKALRLTGSFTTGAVSHELEAAYFDSDRLLSGTNGFGPFLFNFRGTRDSLGYRGNADLASVGIANFGLERVGETYFDDTGSDSQTHKTETNSLFGEIAMAPTVALDVVASVRHDQHSRFGGFTTGRLSTNWRITEDLTLRGNLGNAFRAPSNYELFAYYSYLDQNNNTVVVYEGNPALQPETSVNIDLGIEQRFGEQGMLAATFFAAEAEDLIDYGNSGYVQVAGKVRRHGVEIEGSWAFENDVTVEGNYTYTDSDTPLALASSAWLTTTPRHQLSLGLGAEIGEGWAGNVSATHSAGRVDLPSFTVVDLGVTKELSEGREAYLRIENIFDEDYQSVPGYGTSGRAAFVGLRAKF